MGKPLPSEVSVDLSPDEMGDPTALRRRVARKLRVPEDALPELSLRRRSIDARKGRVRFQLLVELDREAGDVDLGAPHPREVRGEPRVVIVGDGPAGLFCAYQLARRGVACTVVDRGKKVQPRRRDLAALNREGLVCEDSNYCFGEGGAGTYSDGKLYTRSGKRGDVRGVIELLAAHGAPEQILVDARPHIGSNKLPKVVTRLREHLEQVGVGFRFGARVTDLIAAEPAGARRVTGVRLAGGEELGADAVVLATGHSAADVHRMLRAQEVQLEPKPFALGVRIEHPQALVDRIQYGRFAEHPSLPPAYYRISATVQERGVFSFCMCPGGWIVPASTEPGGLVVNGMSLSKRGSRWANSGLVVQVEPGDWEAAGYRGPMGGVELQRAVERAAFDAGGGALVAPATRATDFAARRGSSTVPESSYVPGLTGADVAEVLDSGGVPVAARLREALEGFGRRMRGYLTEEAVLAGVETRTSSPVRIPRDRATLQSPDLAGLYPAGEGAGFAGGIVSAALDGVNVAERVAERLAAPASGGCATRRLPQE